jgi:protocatechuate 3,4-dioxygenase beta subunit
MTVIGTVAGLKCGRIKDATIDVWQADARGQLDASGFRLRGHQLTDANGRYRLTTIIPGAAAGRAPHLSIRVRIAKKIDFWTEAYFPDNPANARDSRFQTSC